MGCVSVHQRTDPVEEEEMGSIEPPTEPESSPREIDTACVRDVFSRLARLSSVKCVREIEVTDPRVIIAFDAQSKFGWTRVLAVRASADTERMVGTLHIRTRISMSSTPSDDWLVQAQKSAVLMRYARAEDEPGVEAQSSLPIPLEPAVFNALLHVLDQIVRLQGAMLLGAVRGQLMTQHAILAMGPVRPSHKELQSAYEALRDAIHPFGVRLIQLDSGCVVSDDDREVAGTDGYRVEVSTNFRHALFESLACAELVVPLDSKREVDAAATATLLNRSEEALDDRALGVGAWYARREDASLRYRILLPFTEQWWPPLDLFLASLVWRWMNIKALSLNVPLDLRLADDLRKLFSDMRSSDARVLRSEQSDGRVSLDDYHRDVGARELLALREGVTVSTINRHVGSPPRRRRTKGMGKNLRR
jgi:hypothetical protein